MEPGISNEASLTAVAVGDLQITRVNDAVHWWDAGVVALDAETGKTVWENVGEKTWNGIPMTGGTNAAPRAMTPRTGSRRVASEAGSQTARMPLMWVRM